MSKYENIIVNLFSKPVSKLRRTNKKPPNREILRLYREVMKFCSEFDWPNENGEIWRDVLRKSARREFEESREETDPVILYRMMVTTRDAMQQTKEMLIKQYAYRNKKIQENDVLENSKGEIGKRKGFDVDKEIYHHLYGSFKD